MSGPVISEEYSLEYGTDTMEMHVGAVEPGEQAIIVDDLIATGGTLGAAIRLLGIDPLNVDWLIGQNTYWLYETFVLLCTSWVLFNILTYQVETLNIIAMKSNLVLILTAERVGVNVVECACLIELAGLKVWNHLCYSLCIS